MIKFKESYAKSRYDFKDKMKAVIDTIYGTKEANNLKGLVGSVVVHFVQCELLGSMLIDVATLTDRGTNVFANKYISKDRILGYKKELSQRKDSIKNQHFKLINSWLDCLEKLKGKRNDVVHSAWIPLVGLNEYDRHFAKRKRGILMETMAKSKLEKINQEMISLHSEGWEIFNKIFPFKISTNK